MIDIPNYQMGDKIGTGGMANVYRAQHKFLPKQVAVKIMSTTYSSNPIFQKCFIKEARTINAFKHKNVVKIYDMGISDDIYYITMECIEGGTLQNKLEQGNIPFTTTLDILKGVVNALEYIHKEGYIHRDIKPANIMFRDNGDVVLTDFGISKLEGSTGSLTKMGIVANTPNYMSPEQAQGNKLDNRVDIYSLGIIFYEMLVGQKPFAAEDTAAMLFQHVNAEIPHLPKKYTDFQPVLDKVLAKKPDDRYQTATDFLQAIEEVKSKPKTTSTKTFYYKYILSTIIICTLAIGGYLAYKKTANTIEPSEQNKPAIPPIPTTPECSVKERLTHKCNTKQ